MISRVLLFALLFVWSSAAPADEAEDPNENELTKFFKNLNSQLQEALATMSAGVDGTIKNLSTLVRAPITCVQRSVEEHGSAIVGPSVLFMAEVSDIIGEHQAGDLTQIVGRTIDTIRALGENESLRTHISAISNGLQKMLDSTNKCMVSEVQSAITTSSKDI